MNKDIFKKINPVITVLTVALVAALAYIILNESGSKTGIDMLDKKLFDDVTVDCSEIEKNLLTAKVNVKVSNRSDQVIHGVSVKATAYDDDGKEIKSKTRSLDDILEPKSTITRTINFPKRTATCRCVLESTTTNY